MDREKKIQVWLKEKKRATTKVKEREYHLKQKRRKRNIFRRRKGERVGSPLPTSVSDGIMFFA